MAEQFDFLERRKKSPVISCLASLKTSTVLFTHLFQSARNRSEKVQTNYSFRNVKVNPFLPQRFPLIRKRGKQQTLFCLPCPLGTAAPSHNSKQQNLPTTQCLFPRPNISSRTREINSKVYIYEYHLAKSATTAYFDVRKLTILMHNLSIFCQS